MAFQNTKAQPADIINIAVSPYSSFRLSWTAVIPNMIKAAQIKYLGISIGSEMSCLLNPELFWVANVRTVWSHLVIKHADDYELASEELDLYRDEDETSEMAYKKWEQIHQQLETSLTRLAELGVQHVQIHHKDIKPGKVTYLWADAIASYLYDEFA